MKPALLAVLLALTLSNRLPGADFDSLVAEYNKVKGQAGREGRGRGGGFGRGRGQRGPDARATAERVLNEIGQLGSNRAIKFLLDEIGRAPSSLATLSARAALTGAHPKGPGLVFGLLGRRPPKVSIAVLDAVDPQPDPGFGWWQRREPARGVEVDWTKVEEQLTGAARSVKDVEVKRRLVPVLANLPGVAAATAIVQVSASASKPRPGDVELHAKAVEALVKVGEDAGVKEWLEKDAFSLAKSNAGMLAVVVDAVGRLELVEVRSRVEELLSHRDDRVAVAAVEALSRLPGHLTDDHIKSIERQLKRKLSHTDRATILDSLARVGTPRPLAVVLDAAQKGDLASRAIAMGSLALLAGNIEAVQALLSGLQDKAVEVRSNALRSLRKVREKVVIPALIERLESESVDRLKADVLRLLVDLTGYDMGFVVADWRKWWTTAEKDFAFEATDKKARTRLVTKKSYFGIEVASKRLAFLLDVSRSMEWGGGRGGFGGPGRGGGGGDQGPSRLDLLKKELTRLLTEMPDDTQLNIITFAGTVENWRDKLQPLSGGGRERAIEFVRGLRTDLHTNVFDSLDRALKDRRVDTIYLLTDGQPTTGRYTDTPGILKGVQELNRVRGVTVHCIAFGEESDLLKQLAEQNGGVYRFVRPEEGGPGEAGRDRSVTVGEPSRRPEETR